MVQSLLLRPAIVLSGLVCLQEALHGAQAHGKALRRQVQDLTTLRDAEQVSYQNQLQELQNQLQEAQTTRAELDRRLTETQVSCLDHSCFVQCMFRSCSD